MSTAKVENVVALLRAAKPAEIAELPFVKDRFISIHNQIHGTDNGEMIYHKELFNFKKILAENEALRGCSPLSLYGCFLDINVNGHSLEQGSKPDCYIIPRGFKTGKGADGKDVYENRATLQVSPYGELKMRMRAGQIQYADNPVVVYDCDLFRVGTNKEGKLVVKEYEKDFSQATGAKIIACFVRVQRPNGTYEMPYLDMPAIDRLKGYSTRNNRGNANVLYTSNSGQIDTGFLMAKTLKHAMTSYPKVQTGKFTTLSAIEEDPGRAAEIDYGIDADAHSGNGFQDVAHTEVQDEFTSALNDAKKTEKEATVQFAIAGDDDDEPHF